MNVSTKSMADFPTEKEILLGQQILETQLESFKNGAPVPFDRAINQFLDNRQIAELAKCIMNSKVWGEDEEPDTSAMYGSYRRWDENPRWNIGMFGSIWMDVNLCGFNYRLAFYTDGESQCVFKIDEFDEFYNITPPKPSGSNYTPPKKKRKKNKKTNRK